MTARSKILRFVTIVLGGVVLVLLGWRLAMLNQSASKAPSAAPDYGRVADFTLTDQTGKAFGLNNLKGKVWVVDFVFTRCMGPCPLLTTKMAQLQSEFPTLISVSLSVDPEYDTPPVLTKYAAAYGADKNRWHFLTGPKPQIFKLIRENFHLAVETRPGDAPDINDILHSMYFVLVDEDGHILAYTDTNDENAMKALRAKIKALS